MKKEVVEKDETETSIRKILNFGHTFGHCIESNEGMKGLLHGECVALGMLPMCSKSVKPDLVEILKKFNLPFNYNGDVEAALSYISHDKKRQGESLSVIFVDSPGECKIERVSTEHFKKMIKNYYF